MNRSDENFSPTASLNSILCRAVRSPENSQYSELWTRLSLHPASAWGGNLYLLQLCCTSDQTFVYSIWFTSLPLIPRVVLYSDVMFDYRLGPLFSIRSTRPGRRYSIIVSPPPISIIIMQSCRLFQHLQTGLYLLLSIFSPPLSLNFLLSPPV
jgi:hypothetical protein